MFWMMVMISSGMQTAVAQTQPSLATLHHADADTGAKGVRPFVIKPKAVVDGDRIYLKDLIGSWGESDLGAEIGNFSIGHSPKPGKERKLTGSWILSRLRSSKRLPQGIEVSAPPIIRVTRTYQKLNPELLRRVFLSYVSSRLGKAKYKISQVKTRGNDKFPVGRMTFSVVNPIPKKLYGRISLRIAVLTDGKAGGRATVSGWIERYETVLCADRYLERDTILTAADLRTRQIQLSKAPTNLVTDLQDAVGKRLKRSLKPEDILHHTMLSAPHLIQKGDKVKLVARNGALRIVTLGIAKSSGGAGDQIRIENITSKKTVLGRVRDSSTVEVIF